MIHQPSGGYSGQATDILIHAEEITKIKKRLNQMYADHTGQSLEVINDAMERDKFMSPEEALKFGLVDKIITSRSDVETK
jgi:ATP-dependent Clp protease protease subunit